ncbi:MAG: beta-N-acetylhexosaminidase [Candidatus Binatia bacterium]
MKTAEKDGAAVVNGKAAETARAQAGGEAHRGEAAKVAPGDMLIIGLPGPELDEEALALLREIRPLGVILFRRNIVSTEQLRRLTAALLEERPDLLLAIDHEGGRVHRMPADFTHFPPSLVMARNGDPGLLKDVARAHAAELREAGFNLTFSPVLDVHTNPDNPIIGDRAFGTTPEEVVHNALPYLQGLIEGGILPCGKHFPAHGDTALDSHLALPVLHAATHDLQRLRSLEFRPFARAISQGLPMIMTAHVVCEAIDPAMPATLSPLAIDGCLRRDLGFDGYVISDDLEMKAVADHFQVGRAAVLSIFAGCDGCLVCATPSLIREAHAALAAAMADGEISAARLAEVARRRDKLLARSKRLARVETAPGSIGSNAHAALSARLRGDVSVVAKA